MNAAEAAWTSAAIAFAALVAVIVFGVLNLRQARRGPAGAVRWHLERTGKSRVEVLNAGTVDARNVTVVVEGSIRTWGESAFEVFAAGQRAAYVIATGMGAGQPEVRITWTNPDGAHKDWRSDLPGSVGL